MAKGYLKIGTMRIAIDSIIAYWDVEVENNRIVVILLQSGDRVAFELETVSGKEIVDYLDKYCGLHHFEVVGGWQHAGQVHQQIKSARL